MKKHLISLCLLCCLFVVSVAHASDKPKPKLKSFNETEYSCSYYNAANGKYYCVETSAGCDIGHAYVKESGSAGSPVLVILSLKFTSGSCKYFEGSLTLSTGNIMVIDVDTCDCGSTITTHVFYTGSHTLK